MTRVDDGGCARGNARQGSVLAIAMITLLGLLRRRRARGARNGG